MPTYYIAVFPTKTSKLCRVVVCQAACPEVELHRFPNFRPQGRLITGLLLRSRNDVTRILRLPCTAWAWLEAG